MSIPIVRSSTGIRPLPRAARIRFGRGQAIQYNVKAKDIGRVREDHVPFLVSYWKTELGTGSGPRTQCDSDATDQVSSQIDTTRLEYPPFSQSAAGTGQRDLGRLGFAPTHTSQTLGNFKEHKEVCDKNVRRDVLHTSGFDYVMQSEVGGELHSGFEVINKPRAFFKKGRIFTILYPELAGHPQTERTVYWKIRRFVVVRPKPTHMLCLPISTYSGKGTSGLGPIAQEHSAIVVLDGEVQLHPDEKPLVRAPIRVKVEDPRLSIDAMSRVNFSRIMTIEYTHKVHNVGRVVAQCIKQMEEYVFESLSVA